MTLLLSADVAVQAEIEGAGSQRVKIEEGKNRRDTVSAVPSEITLERALMLIKGGFSHRLGYLAWQRSFTDRRMRNEQDFLTHREYIHSYPVRAVSASASKSIPTPPLRPPSQRLRSVFSPSRRDKGFQLPLKAAPREVPPSQTGRGISNRRRK
ncbi:MAG: hypothetical protein PW792_00770 [Acidobacteriaceae bacterium]|nr:hypothetical protein [Acidobacteriaceae bacterium]